MGQHNAVTLFVRESYGEGWQILNYANPNRNGWIVLISKDEPGDLGGTTYMVVEEDADTAFNEPFEIYDGLDRVMAERVYAKRVEASKDTPNWDLQDEYDRVHGTINGQDPKILECNELFGEEH